MDADGICPASMQLVEDSDLLCLVVYGVLLCQSTGC
jgi:hypothetical protein